MKKEYEFVDERIEILSKEKRIFAISLISSQDSIPLEVWDLDNIKGTTDTPISFVKSDILNELDPYLFNE